MARGMANGSKKVRYALIGAGNIAQVAVLPAFKHAKSNSELVAVISNDPEKRLQLSKDYDLKLFGDYDDLESILEQGAIDALYVSTPNALHKECVLRAAAAGVHVLCEKPLATSVADCEQMADACAKAGVKLMVAYRLHFEEANLKAQELAKFEKSATHACSSQFSAMSFAPVISARGRTWAAAPCTTWASTASTRLVICFGTSRCWSSPWRNFATVWTIRLRQRCSFRAVASPNSR